MKLLTFYLFLANAIEIIAKLQFYIVNGMGIDVAPIIQQFAIL